MSETVAAGDDEADGTGAVDGTDGSDAVDDDAGGPGTDGRDTGGPGTDGRDAGAADVDDDHLARSREVWDDHSDSYGRSERDFEPMRETAMEYLDLAPGDAVLDVGCGPGVNLATLRDAVGPEGRVVALDYSPEMVARARQRVAAHGWENVEVREADGTTATLEPGGFDAALATLSMSVMPDVAAAVANVHGALAPGARFVVFDLRGVPSGPLRVVNPLLRRFYRWYANWNADEDVLDALAATFDDVRVVETYFAGANYTAVAERGGD